MILFGVVGASRSIRGHGAVSGLLWLVACTFDSSGLGGGGGDDQGSTTQSSDDTSASDPAVTTESGLTSNGTATASGTTSLDGTDDGSTSTVGGSTTAHGSSSTGDTDTVPTGPWGEPVLVEILGDLKGDKDDPTLTGDMLEIVFNAGSPDDLDLFVSTRDHLEEPWSAPVLLGGSINTYAHENTPELSLDGLILTFARHTGGSSDFDLFIATREGRGQDFGTPVALDDLNATGADLGATLDPTHSFVLLCSTRLAQNQPPSIFRADVIDLEAREFTEPTLATGLSTDVSDCTTGIPARGHVYFESDRADGEGDWDIWTADWDPGTQDWTNAMPVVEVNTEYRDLDPWVSPDDQYMYLARRAGQTEDLELYVSQRERQ